MKMTKKKTALLAAFAVSVIALAGLGYAATYNSVVVTTGNNADTAFIKATTTTYTNAFDGNVEFDTYTEAVDTYIYVIQGGSTLLEEGVYGKKVNTNSFSMTLSAAPTVNPTAWSIGAIVDDNNILDEDWKLYMKISYTKTGDLGAGQEIVEIVGGEVADTALTDIDITKAVTADIYIGGPAFGNSHAYTPAGWASLGSSTTYDGATTAVYNANVVFTVTATA